MQLESLTALSSVDGRYRATASLLAPYLSEYALIRFRVFVECEYLVALSETPKCGMRKLSPAEKKSLRALSDVSLDEAQIIQRIEREGYGDVPATNHDVKAVEYFLKRRLSDTSMKDVLEWIHFALTSEDVNSVSYALMLRAALSDVLLPKLEELRAHLDGLAREHAALPMLARTHGQAATPTTFGKEMRVFERRLARELDGLARTTLYAKFSGATGNWNAHALAAPDVDWRAFSRQFLGGLGGKGGVQVVLNEVTTQIEPHDSVAELFDRLRRTNTILLDLSQDMWRYISDGWVAQKPKNGEVGSSAMPHKVNPIDFENAEGNLGLANALFEHFSRKLPVSRLQRDLSDSTVERSFGGAFGHCLIAYAALYKGFGKTQVNAAALARALEEHPEVLAEAVQTVLRREGVAVPYEQLKELTRGRAIALDDLVRFVSGLSIDAKTKKRLKALTPAEYIGLAAEIAAGK